MTTWLRFEDFKAYGLNDEPVVSCHFGKVFQFSEGRSAWWGNPSLRYPGIESFWPQVGEAQTEELGCAQREQARSWRSSVAKRSRDLLGKARRYGVPDLDLGGTSRPHDHVGIGECL